MATMQELESALVKADAAGNVDDARQLAAAIRKMRGSGSSFQVGGSLAPGQIEAGNIDLSTRPRVRNPDGSISTVRSMSANFDGQEVLLPTVSDDGRIMSNDEAIQQYRRTGRNLGKFSSPDAANAYAQRLHEQQAAEYLDPRADFSGVTSRVIPPAPTPNPSLFRADSDFADRAGVSIPTQIGAAARDMFVGHEAAGNYLAKQVPGSAVVKDAQGEPLLRLQDGTSYRLNDPGIDSTDVANVAGNIAAFALPASWLARLGQARNIGVAGRAVLQGLGAGATDAGIQAAVNGGDVNLGKVAASTAGGGIGEGLGTVLGGSANKLMELARRASGRNAQEATNMLNQAGLQATPAAVNRLVPQVEQVRAGANPNALLGQSEHGFQYTLGQRMTNPQEQFRQLTREEALRQSPAGGGQFRELDRANAERLNEAVSGITQRFGGRAAQSPAEMVEGAASGLRQQAQSLDNQVQSAYQQAAEKGATVYPSAVSQLPSRVKQALTDVAMSPELTPAARTAVQEIERRAGAMTANSSSAGMFTNGVKLQQLEGLRRYINTAFDGAGSRADSRAMTILKGEFDGWMDDAFDSALMGGDPSALQAMKNARALRSEYARRFEGGSESDRFISGLLDGSRTPEELVNIALGASQVSKSGGARFIERLRLAANDDPEIIGGLRAAHFSRLTRGKDGNVLGAKQVLNNIRQTEYNNASVVRALYEPQQWAEVRRLANALEPLVSTGDFARSSGSGERVMRYIQSVVGGGLQGIPLAGEMLIKPLTNGRTYMQAQRAINAPVQAAARTYPLAPAAGAALADD